jgi:hypothetical protein
LPSTTVTAGRYLDPSRNHLVFALGATGPHSKALSGGTSRPSPPQLEQMARLLAMTARGPDFRDHYIDELPASNADIGMTVADLLHLKLTPVGSLTGRVLNESRRGHDQDPLPPVEPQAQQSAPAANGLKTVLEKQVVDGHSYFDSAGFPGRTIELGNR